MSDDHDPWGLDEALASWATVVVSDHLREGWWDTHHHCVTLLTDLLPYCVISLHWDQRPTIYVSFTLNEIVFHFKDPGEAMLFKLALES